MILKGPGRNEKKKQEQEIGNRKKQEENGTIRNKQLEIVKNSK